MGFAWHKHRVREWLQNAGIKPWDRGGLRMGGA